MQPETDIRDETPAPAGTETPPLDASLEALLFASEEPLAPPRLAQLTGARKGEVLEAIDRLNVFYAESGRAFRIAPLAGGFQLVTTPEHAARVGQLHRDKSPAKLSRAALETLAIVAFKQPVTRAEVDSIRGVSASDGVIRHLLERGLVRIAGRAEAPGRPLLYGTTREFLGRFGLHALGDLPRSDELAALQAGDTRTPLPDEETDAEETGEVPGAVPVRAAWEDDDAGESHSGRESDEDDGDPPAQ